MSVAQHISEAEYEQIVWAHPQQTWELVEGRLREKPGMTFEHGDTALELAYRLRSQLDRRQFRIAINDWRLRWPTATILIPDVVVVPIAMTDEFRGQPGRLVIYTQPLPLVVEVWSRSTGDYDLEAKIPVYQLRGDLEIWRIHPYERTLTAWRRQPDGSYVATVYHEGTVMPATLPGVAIDLAELFDN